MSKKSFKIASLILAAGESKRLGEPKQNLVIGNTTLLNHTIQQLDFENVDRRYVVLGANAKEIIIKPDLERTEIILFDDWRKGMGSSLSFACSTILNRNNYDGLLITLSDLPLVDKVDYQRMIDLFNSKADIVATQAGKSLGVPAIFGSYYFEELLTLSGEKGAKSIISKYMGRVKVFENKKAAIDIDTVEDYKGLNLPAE